MDPWAMHHGSPATPMYLVRALWLNWTQLSPISSRPAPCKCNGDVSSTFTHTWTNFGIHTWKHTCLIIIITGNSSSRPPGGAFWGRDCVCIHSGVKSHPDCHHDVNTTELHRSRNSTTAISKVSDLGTLAFHSSESRSSYGFSNVSEATFGTSETVDNITRAGCELLLLFYLDTILLFGHKTLEHLDLVHVISGQDMMEYNFTICTRECFFFAFGTWTVHFYSALKRIPKHLENTLWLATDHRVYELLFGSHHLLSRRTQSWKRLTIRAKGRDILSFVGLF